MLSELRLVNWTQIHRTYDHCRVCVGNGMERWFNRKGFRRPAILRRRDEAECNMLFPHLICLWRSVCKIVVENILPLIHEDGENICLLRGGGLVWCLADSPLKSCLMHEVVLFYIVLTII